MRALPEHVGAQGRSGVGGGSDGLSTFLDTPRNKALAFAKKLWGPRSWLLEGVIVLELAFGKIEQGIIIAAAVILGSAFSLAEQRCQGRVRSAPPMTQLGGSDPSRGPLGTAVASPRPRHVAHLRQCHLAKADQGASASEVGLERSGLTKESNVASVTAGGRPTRARSSARQRRALGWRRRDPRGCIRPDRRARRVFTRPRTPRIARNERRQVTSRPRRGIGGGGTCRRRTPPPGLGPHRALCRKTARRRVGRPLQHLFLCVRRSSRELAGKGRSSPSSRQVNWRRHRVDAAVSQANKKSGISTLVRCSSFIGVGHWMIAT